MAALLVTALVAGACGGDDAKSATSPAEAEALAAKYPEGVLPKLCRLVTKKEVADATGQTVGDVRDLPAQCAYYTPDGKGLVASVYAHRPGTVAYDDFEHTDVAKKEEDVEGADRAAFLGPYFIMAALKGDIYVHVQVPNMRKAKESKVHDVTKDLLEKALTRL